MKAMKWLGIALLTVVILFVAIGAMGSKDYALARSIVIDAPPEAIHPYLENLEKWPEWVPWERDDPSIQTTYGSVTVGAGASQTWTSDDGPGRLELTRSDVSSGIAYDMAFGEGDGEMPASCQMNYRAVDGGTQVIWHADGISALVVFEKGSPFRDDEFRVPENGATPSGPAGIGTHEESERRKGYEYNVYPNGDREKPLDPKVFIDR